MHADTRAGRQKDEKNQQFFLCRSFTVGYADTTSPHTIKRTDQVCRYSLLVLVEKDCVLL